MVEGREEKRIGTMRFRNTDEEHKRWAMADIEESIPAPDGAKSARIETYELENGEVEIVKVIQW